MTDSRLVSATTRFAFKLLAKLTAQEPGKNVFISPASVALALSMTYNGARGETQRAMAAALELGEMSLEDLNRASAELIRSLGALDPQVRLAIASSLWARTGVTFDPDFLARARSFYGAEVQALDFGDPRAAAVINAWVSAHTSGKIERIVDQIHGDAILFLINAIYFKGSWTSRFDERLTREKPFTLINGRTQQCPMMSQSGEFPYIEGRGFQAISLPYGDRRLSMCVFLPEPRSGMEAFRRELTGTNWDAWMRRFRPAEGRITLPRFKIEYAVTLNDSLIALGMGVAFDGRRADFRGMCAAGPNVSVDEVRHKTFVEVNEEGTEAAAATSVGMIRASFVPGRTFSMVVDRPFFCAIRDHQTGAILFMGSIVDPK